MSGCNFGEKFEQKIRLLRDAQVERREEKQKFKKQQKLSHNFQTDSQTQVHPNNAHLQPTHANSTNDRSLE